jgi:hypothetical protein
MIYGYDADNRRVYSLDTSASLETVYFFGATGQRMGAYTLSASAGNPPFSGASLTLALPSDRVYFGGKQIRGDAGVWADPDRLGSSVW